MRYQLTEPLQHIYFRRLCFNPQDSSMICWWVRKLFSSESSQLGVKSIANDINSRVQSQSWIAIYRGSLQTRKHSEKDNFHKIVKELLFHKGEKNLSIFIAMSYVASCNFFLFYNYFWQKLIQICRARQAVHPGSHDLWSVVLRSLWLVQVDGCFRERQNRWIHFAYRQAAYF